MRHAVHVRRMRGVAAATSAVVVAAAVLLAAASPAAADSVVDTYANVGGANARTSIAVSPDGTRIYAADGAANSVTVLNASDGSVIGTVPLPGIANTLALSPSGDTLYAGAVMGASGPYEIVAVDTATLVAGSPTLLPDSPASIEATPDGSRVYVSLLNSSSVAVLASSDFSTVATIPLDSQPRKITFSPDGARAYVGHWSGPATGNRISVIDTATATVATTIPTAVTNSRVAGSALSADGSRLYATRFALNAVDVIDTTSNTIVGTITGIAAPGGIDLTPDGTRAYVASTTGDTVAIIDLATNTVSQTIPVGDNPQDLAVSPDGAFAYAANATARTVSVIAIDTFPTITTTSLPSATAAAPYSVVIASTGSPAPNLAVTAGTLPDGLTLDPVSGALAGTPTATGTFSFTVTASSTVSGIPSTATQEYTITVAAAPTVPSAPLELSATPSTSAIVLNWEPPADNGGTPLTGYRIERALGGGAFETIVADTATTSTTYTDTAVTTGQDYRYRVTALNAVGAGEFSNIAAATLVVTPPTPTPAPAPAAQSSGLATTGGTGAWTAATSAALLLTLGASALLFARRKRQST